MAEDHNNTHSNITKKKDSIQRNDRNVWQLLIHNLFPQSEDVEKEHNRSFTEPHKHSGDISHTARTKIKDDKLDISYFAEHLTECIVNADLEKGLVIALTGKWGVGKSTVLNFTREYLVDKDEQEEFTVYEFNPWYFDNIEDITRGFFREFSRIISKNIGTEARETLEFIYAEIKPGISAVTTIADISGGNGVFTTAKKISDNSTKKDNSQHLNVLLKELEQELEFNKNKKFLIFIDDLDRLEPDELIQMFKLIKTIGALPNVLFLISLDLDYATTVINQKFDEVDTNYLDKIIQVIMPLPYPETPQLESYLLEHLKSINEHFLNPEHLTTGDLKHEEEIFEQLVSLLETPRDVIRLIQDVKFNWEPIKKEVNFIEFVCVQFIKQKYLETYNNIITHKNYLTDELMFPDDAQVEKIKACFVTTEKAYLRTGLEKLLTELYPTLKSDKATLDKGEWDVRKRVCSPKYFDVYFRIRNNPNVPNTVDIEYFYNTDGVHNQIELILLYRDDKHASPEIKLKNYLKSLTNLIRIKPELYDKAKSANLIKELVKRANELFFFGGYNHCYWQNEKFIRTLLANYFKISERSPLFLEAMKLAPFDYLMYVCNDLSNQVAISKRIPDETGYPDYTLNETDAHELRVFILKSIKNKIKEEDFISAPYMPMTLNNWRQFKPSASDEIKEWFSEMSKDDRAVCYFAKMFTSTWTGSGSLSLTHDPTQIKLYIEPEEFKKRVDESLKDNNLTNEERGYLKTFIEAYKDPFVLNKL